MSNDEKEKNYVKVLIKKLLEKRNLIDYEIIDECFNEVFEYDRSSFTIDELREFTDSFSENLNVVTYQISEKHKRASEKKKIVINGIELTRDYYSVRTDAPRILGISAPTLNKRVNEGTISCIPGFRTKKVSSEEMYNFYIRYLRK